MQKTFRTDHLSKRTQINQGELPKFHVQEAHEPIVDRVTFEAVQEEIMRRRESVQVEPGSATVLTGKIRCGICGKHYRRKITTAGIAWVCATYNVRGKKYCASKKIPEETIKAVSAEILDSDAFDDVAFAENIDFITALPDNALEYNFVDGQTTRVIWQDRSRAESWTEEMRRASAEKTKHRSGKKCQEQ